MVQIYKNKLDQISWNKTKIGRFFPVRGWSWDEQLQLIRFFLHLNLSFYLFITSSLFLSRIWNTRSLSLFLHLDEQLFLTFFLFQPTFLSLSFLCLKYSFFLFLHLSFFLLASLYISLFLSPCFSLHFSLFLSCVWNTLGANGLNPISLNDDYKSSLSQDGAATSGQTTARSLTTNPVKMAHLSWSIAKGWNGSSVSTKSSFFESKWAKPGLFYR